jgi:hypothetical protein
MNANVSEVISMVGLGVLVLNAGIQWGLLLAASSQHKREIERLEASIHACKTGWESESKTLEDKLDGIGNTLHSVETSIARIEERILKR